MARRGPWALRSPSFVDERDASSCTRPEDRPIRTVGAVLSLPEPPEPTGPSEADAAALADVEWLLQELADYSRATLTTLEIQLDDNVVGEIRGGVPERTIEDGLLAPWRAAVRGE